MRISKNYDLGKRVTTTKDLERENYNSNLQSTKKSERLTTKISIENSGWEDLRDVLAESGAILSG